MPSDEKASAAEQSGRRRRPEAAPVPMLDQIVTLFRKLRERQEEIAKRRGLTFLQYLAIQVLCHKGSMNVTQLAEELHIKHSTVSKLVDRMERDRLLIRVQGSDDRRISKLRLTERALERVEGLSLSIADFSQRLMGYLSAAEQQQLFVLLGKLRGAFEKELDRLAATKPDVT